jgi:hypothetical protein
MALNLNELQQKIDRLLFNLEQMRQKAFRLFYSGTPENVEIQQYDENGFGMMQELRCQKHFMLTQPEGAIPQETAQSQTHLEP